MLLTVKVSWGSSRALEEKGVGRVALDSDLVYVTSEEGISLQVSYCSL